MTTQQLEQLIGQLAQSSKINEADIIKDVADYAQLKFGNNITAKERAIIDKIKEKIILGLYKMIDHTLVSKKPDLKKVFGFDSLDLKYAQKASEELEKEGLIEGQPNYSKLLDEGILKAKELLGII